MKLIYKSIGALLAAGTVAGFVATMIVVNKKDEVDVPPPNKVNKNPLGWNTTTQKHSINGDHLRIANWNLQNFNGLDYAKNEAAASIINDSNVSLVGVEEVDYLSALYGLANKLNKIQGKPNAWKVVSSDLSYKATGNSSIERMSGLSAQEYYGFIYDSSYLMPKEDKNHKIGSLYTNEFSENRFLQDAKNIHGVSSITNTQSAYVRPPFGVTFEYKKNKKDFTAVIAHLDSPGASANAGKSKIKNISSDQNPTFEYHSSSKAQDLLSREYGSKIGSQEAWEAEQLPQVMNYFDGINGADNDMIFMGDTNISDTGTKKKKPFQNMLDAKYKQSFDPANPDSKTSIGPTGYVNPYDRIFFKNNKIRVNIHYKIERSPFFQKNI